MARFQFNRILALAAPWTASTAPLRDPDDLNSGEGSAYTFTIVVQ